MIRFLICGIHNNSIIPIKIYSDNGISVTNSVSNNKLPGKSELKGLLLGKHESQLLPILIDNNGRLIV